MKTILTKQSIEFNKAKPFIDEFKILINLRTEIWTKLPLDGKREWIENSELKDPIMFIAYDLYNYLKNYFEEVG